MFCHPQPGGLLDNRRYAETFRAALVEEAVEGEIRTFHDGRHTSITNAAAAGVASGALDSTRGSAVYRTDNKR